MEKLIKYMEEIIVEYEQKVNIDDETSNKDALKLEHYKNTLINMKRLKACECSTFKRYFTNRGNLPDFYMDNVRIYKCKCGGYYSNLE